MAREKGGLSIHSFLRHHNGCEITSRSKLGNKRVGLHRIEVIS